MANEATKQVTEYAVPTIDEYSDYQTLLTAELIKRMYKFCKENDIKLIVIDILF